MKSNKQETSTLTPLGILSHKKQFQKYFHAFKNLMKFRKK